MMVHSTPEKQFVFFICVNALPFSAALYAGLKYKTYDMNVQLLVFTCSQSQPEWVAVLGFKGAISYGENTLWHVHDGREGRHGEEDEGSGGQHHVPCVQYDRHAEEDIGEQPAAKRRPVKMCSLLNSCYFLTATRWNGRHINTTSNCMPLLNCVTRGLQRRIVQSICTGRWVHMCCSWWISLRCRGWGWVNLSQELPHTLPR